MNEGLIAISSLVQPHHSIRHRAVEREDPRPASSEIPLRNLRRALYSTNRAHCQALTCKGHEDVKKRGQNSQSEPHPKELRNGEQFIQKPTLPPPDDD